MLTSLRSYLEREFNALDKRLVSGAVTVEWQGESVYEKFFGLANQEHSIPICAATMYPISSVTKQFTAMITMLAEEEGLLRYEDNVGKYLLDFPSYGAKITIRNLLHHVTGLLDPYTYYEEQQMSSYDMTNTTIYRLLQNSRGLKFDLGERFEYCNSNYVLLAMIAEKVYGKPFRQLLQQKIFAPLNMRCSDLYDSRGIIRNRAYGYARQDNCWSTVDNYWLCYGDGGIVSTIGDLASWLREMETLVSEDTIRLAYEPGKTNDGNPTGYGFGWVIKEVNGQIVVRHAGGDIGFGSLVLRVPAKKFSMVILSNVDGSWKEFARIGNHVQEIVAEGAGANDKF